MRTHYFLLLLAFASCYFCSYGQTDEVVFFEIVRTGPTLEIPDSVSEHTFSGQIVCQLYISKSLEIYSHRIRKVKLSNSATGENFTYTNTSIYKPLDQVDEYPCFIQGIYPYLDKYIDSLQIVSKKEGNSDLEGDCLLLINLNDGGSN